MLERPDDFRLNIHSPLANGLVFAGLGRRGSDKTTLYEDSSLHGNDGTLTLMNPATDWVWVPELGRWGLDFDGSNDAVSVPHSASYKPSGAMSICYFLRGSNDDLYYSSGMGWLGNAGARGASVGPVNAESTNIVAYVATSSTGLYSVTGTAMNPDFSTWIHVAMVFVPSVGLYLYRNGALFSSNTTGPPASQYVNASAMQIGNRGDSLGALTGRISDPLIYSRALSPSEIAALADPSNVMYNGLLLPPARKWWPVVSGGTPPSANIPAFMHHRRMLGAA